MSTKIWSSCFEKDLLMNEKSFEILVIHQVSDNTEYSESILENSSNFYCKPILDSPLLLGSRL